MSTTQTKLKKEKELLTKYANNLGIIGNWDAIKASLLVTEDTILRRDDETAIPVVPQALLETSLEGDKILKLITGIFQPGTSYVTSRAMFFSAFTGLADTWKKTGRAPVLSKGVSYPSSLQKGKSEDLLFDDNPWLLDLFSGGVAYSEMAGEGKYRVLDTTCYELWNRVNEKEQAYILERKERAKILVGRFLEVLNDARFSYLRNNIATRGNYLAAIARVLKLPEPIKMQQVIESQEFKESLDDILAVAGDPLKLFCYEGATNARDFAPFVYAEENSANRLFGVDACTGPMREDLPLNVKVLEMFRMSGKKPTPVIWYTRPGYLPRLTFGSTEEEVKRSLSDVGTLFFAGENLVRAGRLNPNCGRNPSMIPDAFYGFIKEVQAQYLQA